MHSLPARLGDQNALTMAEESPQLTVYYDTCQR
jgi:hypothetical protein